MVKEAKEIEGANPFELPKLSDIVDSSIVIVDVKFDEGQYGEYAVIKTAERGEYRTSNKVVLKKLHRWEDAIKNEGVHCIVVKTKSTTHKGFAYIDLI